MATDKLIGDWTTDLALTFKAAGEEINDPAELAEMAEFMPTMTATFTASEVTIEADSRQVMPYQITQTEGATLTGEVAGAIPLKIQFESDDRMIMDFAGELFGLKRT
jgi:hypothetical protein